MDNHTNSKNSLNDIAKEEAKIRTKEEQKNVQPERASIVDLYKYAELRYLVVLFIGITAFVYKIIYVVIVRYKYESFKNIIVYLSRVSCKTIKLFYIFSIQILILWKFIIKLNEILLRKFIVFIIKL